MVSNMKEKSGKSGGEAKGKAGEEKLSRRAAIKRIAAVFAGAAISAAGAAGNDKLAAGNPQAYSSSYASFTLPYVRYSSFAYLSLSYSSFLGYSSIYVPPWRP